MSILQIGAGGVGWVIAHKACLHNDVLGDLVIASRSRARIDRILESVRRKGNLKEPGRRLSGHVLDAHDVDAVARTIEEVRPTLVVNAGPPWVNVDVMEACVRTGTPYLDT